MLGSPAVALGMAGDPGAAATAQRQRGPERRPAHLIELADVDLGDLLRLPDLPAPVHALRGGHVAGPVASIVSRSVMPYFLMDRSNWSGP